MRLQMYLSLVFVLANLQYFSCGNYNVTQADSKGSKSESVGRRVMNKDVLERVLATMPFKLEHNNAHCGLAAEIDFAVLIWHLAILQLNLIKMTMQSIAGVTYMDHFDFEERYRDVHECDPFYWHPLHLPEDCAEMYEDLIRSRIGLQAPVRIVKERQDIIYKLNTHNYFDEPIFRAVSVDAPYYNYKLTPYEKMFAYLKSDITKHPKAPTIEIMPNFGPMAVYRQPVSRRSKAMIKKIAEAYSEVMPTYEKPGEFFGKIDVKHTEGNKRGKVEVTTNSNVPTGPVKIKKKYKHGDIVSIKTIRE